MLSSHPQYLQIYKAQLLNFKQHYFFVLRFESILTKFSFEFDERYFTLPWDCIVKKYSSKQALQELGLMLAEAFECTIIQTLIHKLIILQNENLP